MTGYLLCSSVPTYQLGGIHRRVDVQSSGGRRARPVVQPIAFVRLAVSLWRIVFGGRSIEHVAARLSVGVVRRLMHVVTCIRFGLVIQ